MAYDTAHYEKVATLYRENGSCAKVQDHFPTYSIRSVQRWVRKCRAMGLL